MHHGAQIDEGDVVNRFAEHGLQVFRRVAKSVHRFSRKVEFLDYIDRMKLSGGSQ